MYFIVSHDRMSGLGSDDSLYGNGQNDYLELGWELAASRIYFNLLFENGLFNNETDYVVAAKDRAFLYSKYVKNVMYYKDFEKMYFDLNGNVLFHDLTINGLQEALANIIPNGHNYSDNIKSLKVHTEIEILNENKIVKNNNKFICLAVRKRSHEPGRAMPNELVDYIIEYTTKMGIDVYVFGKGCEDYDNGNNVHYVSYQECATLINSDNCLLFISSLSGGGMIRFFTGKCKHFVLDCLNEYDARNPFNYGNEIDFSGVIKNNLLIIENNILTFIEKFQEEIKKHL